MPSMESNYVLNVARKAPRYGSQAVSPYYLHYFRVELGPDMEAAKEAARDIVARFPAPEFRTDLTYWKCYGQEVPLSDER